MKGGQRGDLLTVRPCRQINNQKQKLNQNTTLFLNYDTAIFILPCFLTWRLARNNLANKTNYFECFAVTNTQWIPSLPNLTFSLSFYNRKNFQTDQKMLIV